MRDSEILTGVSIVIAAGAVLALVGLGSCGPRTASATTKTVINETIGDPIGNAIRDAIRDTTGREPGSGTGVGPQTMAPAPALWKIEVEVVVEGQTTVAIMNYATRDRDGDLTLVVFDEESVCQEALLSEPVHTALAKFFPTLKGSFGDTAEVVVSCVQDKDQ